MAPLLTPMIRQEITQPLVNVNNFGNKYRQPVMLYDNYETSKGRWFEQVPNFHFPINIYNKLLKQQVRIRYKLSIFHRELDNHVVDRQTLVYAMVNELSVWEWMAAIWSVHLALGSRRSKTVETTTKMHPLLIGAFRCATNRGKKTHWMGPWLDNYDQSINPIFSRTTPLRNLHHEDFFFNQPTPTRFWTTEVIDSPLFFRQIRGRPWWERPLTHTHARTRLNKHYVRMRRLQRDKCIEKNMIFAFIIKSSMGWRRHGRVFIWF